MVAHDASDGLEGPPRILADVREAGVVVSRKAVAKLLRDSEIRGVRPRPWRSVKTITNACAYAIPDLGVRRFGLGVLNAVLTLGHHPSGHRSGLAAPVPGA